MPINETDFFCILVLFSLFALRMIFLRVCAVDYSNLFDFLFEICNDFGIAYHLWQDKLAAIAATVIKLVLDFVLRSQRIACNQNGLSSEGGWRQYCFWTQHLWSLSSLWMTMSWTGRSWLRQSHRHWLICNKLVPIQHCHELKFQ